MLLRLYFFIIFFYIIPALLIATPNIVLQNNISIYKDFKIEFFEDTQNKDPTLEEVIKLPFKKTIANAFSLGYKNYPIWLRFNIHNQNRKTKNLILEITEMFHKTTDLYILSNSIKYEKNGLSIPISHRMIQEINPAFLLHFSPFETKQLYIKLESSYGLFAAVEVKTVKKYRKDTQFQNNLYIFYFGAIIVIALFNFFIYLFLKEKVYIYYVLYVLTFGLWVSLYRGLLFYYIDIYTYNFLQISIPIFFIMLILFSQTVLKTKKYFSTIHKILNIFILLMCISLVLMIVSIHTGFLFMNILVIPILPLLLFLALKASHQGYFMARIYLLALFIYFIGMSLVTFLALGLLPYSLTIRNAPVIGSFFEVILFSLLLAYRINILRQEKLEFQEQLLSQEKNEKTRLFHMVANKTMALNHAKEKLENELKKKKILEKHLKEQASTDSMTGLLNRRAFFDASTKALERSQRYDTALSCLIIDIDHFKQVNDTYGHHVGDIVIKKVTKEMIKNTRSIDIVGRIGGEEFAILMPDTNSEDAFQMAERIREKIEKKMIHFDNKVICVTISIGLSTVKGDHNSTLQTILQQSDDALYQAKEHGRNQIITY